VCESVSGLAVYRTVCRLTSYDAESTTDVVCLRKTNGDCKMMSQPESTSLKQESQPMARSPYCNIFVLWVHATES
jgi:hypothetical protein